MRPQGRVLNERSQPCVRQEALGCAVVLDEHRCGAGAAPRREPDPPLAVAPKDRKGGRRDAQGQAPAAGTHCVGARLEHGPHLVQAPKHRVGHGRGRTGQLGVERVDEDNVEAGEQARQEPGRRLPEYGSRGVPAAGERERSASVLARKAFREPTEEAAKSFPDACSPPESVAPRPPRLAVRRQLGAVRDPSPPHLREVVVRRCKPEEPHGVAAGRLAPSYLGDDRTGLDERQQGPAGEAGLLPGDDHVRAGEPTAENALDGVAPAAIGGSKRLGELWGSATRSPPFDARCVVRLDRHRGGMERCPPVERDDGGNDGARGRHARRVARPRPQAREAAAYHVAASGVAAMRRSPRVSIGRDDLGAFLLDPRKGTARVAPARLARSTLVNGTSRVTPERVRRRRRGLRRRWLVAAALAAVAAVQFAMARNVLDRPFLDTRIHFNYDNAFFSFTARNGLRRGDLRSQLGVTLATYSCWDGPPLTVGYYTDHPFLLKAAFQQVARFAGTGEAVSRVFYLIVSFGVVAGFLLLMLECTGSLSAAFLATMVLALTPLFAVYQTCVKFETDGMLLGVWLLLAVTRSLRRGRLALRTVGTLAALAVLAHWTAAICLGVTAIWLAARVWRRHDRASRRLLLAVAVGGALGTALLGALMVWLQGSMRATAGVLSGAAAHRAGEAGITAGRWLARQRTFVGANFGPVLPWVALSIALGLMLRWVLTARARGTTSATTDGRNDAFGLVLLATLTTAVLWQLAFRQGSFVHVYWQYWFTLPVAALIARGIGALRGRRSATLIAVVAAAILLVHLAAVSTRSLQETLHSQLGTPADIEFLTAIRADCFDRLAFVPVSDNPLNAWFEGPLFEYYTDRAVVTLPPGPTLRATDKVLMLRYKDRDIVRAQVEATAGVRLVHERCGVRVCAYDVARP
jgi:hypothetical protein